MGLFDFLFGKKSTAANAPEPGSDFSPPAARPSGWTQRCAQAQRDEDFDWDWGNAGAHALAHAALKMAQPKFGTPAKPAIIKELPDDENIDLRGSYKGMPIRFAVWMSFGTFWTIELMAPQLMGMFHLQRDLEKIPKQVEPDDPWSKDEGVRVFVGKGMFFEGDEGTVQSQLSVWNEIPETQRDHLLSTLEKVDGNGVLYSGTTLKLMQTPGLDDVSDPVGYMETCAELLAGFLAAAQAAGITQGAGAVGHVAATAAARESCTYCGSLFFLSPAHPSCPNCGATPRA